MVPLLTIAWGIRKLPLRYLIAICGTFFIQDIIFYGFGRDCNPGKDILTRFYMGWTTNVLALINVTLFLWIFITPCRKSFNKINVNF